MSTSPVPSGERIKTTTYPSAWCNISLKLEDIGQNDTESLVKLAYIPLSASVTKNAFNKADTYDITIDFEDFPFDPRIIQGGTCEIFMAETDSLDIGWWGKQSEATLRKLSQIIGVIDHIAPAVGGEGRFTKLKGRDYTAYFLDVEADAKPVSFVKPGGDPFTFVEVIEAQIQARELTKKIKIRDPDKIEEIFPRDYKMRAADTKTGTRKKKQGEVIWELLTEIALEAGHIIYMDLDEIVIRKPETIYLKDGADPDDWYRFTLGTDLSEFNPERSMGRQQGINVRVMSWNEDDKEALSSNFPKNPFPKVEIAAKGVGEEGPSKTTATPTANYTPFVFRGITDQARLDDIAKQIYALIEHHEIEGTLSTSEMRDSKGRPVWAIRYGDPVTIDRSETLRSIVTLDAAEQIRRLVDDTGLEKVSVEAITNAEKAANVPFYFDSVTMNFDSRNEGAFSMKAEIRSRKQVNVEEIASTA